MISPSRGLQPHHICALVLWVGLATASPATAQDTLQIATPGQQPSVHIVQQGETLWSLAGRYLGDPLLWPEIYRLNTLVVEDPHWIFPGEELLLAEFAGPGMPVTVTGPPGQTPEGTPGIPGQTVEQPGQPGQPVVAEAPPPPPVPPPPPPSTESSPTVFMTAEGARRPGDIGGFMSRWRPVRRSEFYAAGFLTEEQDLPWAEVLGAVGKPTLANLGASSSQRIYGEIEIRAPSGAEYRVGDSLLVARQGRSVSGWGKIVVPSAIARVTRVRNREVVAVIVEQFERVADGQHALPLEPFRDPGLVVPVPVEDGMMAQVIVRRDRNPLAGQQDILFIDLGREDGIALGDVFEVLRQVGTNTDGSPHYQQLGVMHIVHMRERSSSAILMFINDIGSDAGAPVRLHRKMPS